MSINTDIWQLQFLRKKTLNRYIFTTSLKYKIFVSSWKESHLAIHKV